MKCQRCQYENPAGMKFCGECGARLEAVCPACKFANPPNHKFCGECGERLTTTAPAPADTRPVPAAAVSPAPQSYAPAPESYTPKHLAERILSSRVALEGERKHVTVLFADLKGSTELIQGLDPEDTRSLLDQALHIMMDGVHAYEGTVNQIMGDGIMALFGAPLAHEDHAVRACYAALHMQQGIRRYAEETMRLRGVPVRIRVGLNSGEVVVRTIANDLRMDYSAIGPTTHLAARMEQNAQDNTTFMTPETYRLVEGYMRAHSIGRIPVKGVPEPMEVFELDGVGALRTRLQVSAARGLTKFVGRERELDVLRNALELSASGQGQMVSLVGEAGTGKSRIVWEVTQAMTEGWLVAETSSNSYGKAGPYFPVIDMLRRYCGVEAGDDGQAIRDKLTAKLKSLDDALLPTLSLLPNLPVFLTLLDVPVDPSVSPAEAEWQAMDPPQRRRRTLDAMTAVLIAESRRQPLLLVVEDVQSVDAESRAVVDRLVESLPDQRMMLLVTYRQEQHQPPPQPRPGFTQLLIEALPPESADELLNGLMGESDELAEVKQFLIERTKGNPFFLEELVRTMVETGVLEGERGAYRLAKPLSSVQVPASVQAVLSARIDRLAPDDKRLLQAAAVIGKDVPYPVLQAIAEYPPPELDPALERLQSAQFLYATEGAAEAEFTFKHGLTREVAYEGLLLQKRRALHAEIVSVIEALYPERIAEHADRLAHHALAGEVWRKAVDYSRQVAAKAAQTAAYRAAIGALEQALVALEHLPSSPETQRESIDIRLELRSSLMPSGELQIMHDHLLVAQHLADELHDRERLTRIYSYLCQYFGFMRQLDTAIEWGERAVQLANQLEQPDLVVLSSILAGEVLLLAGQFGACVAMQRRSIELLQGELQYQRFGMTGLPAAFSRGITAFCLAELGEFAEARADSAEAIHLAQEINHPYTLEMVFLYDGFLHLTQGQLQEAVASLRQAIDLCNAWNFPVLRITATARLGYAHVLSGYVELGIPLLEQATAQADAAGRHYEHATIVAWLAHAYLLAGRPEEAVKEAKRAYELAEASKQQAKIAHTLRILGEMHAAGDSSQLDEAKRYFVRALHLAIELGMRPLQAHCHLGLSRVYERQNLVADAKEHITEAVCLYKTLEMGSWLREAERQLSELSAEAPARTDSVEPPSTAELSRIP
jgi:class 3 adenylate cyclase/tetratricopeptide (TPR) repeat protein